jgi:hypothetical protein
MTKITNSIKSLKSYRKYKSENGRTRTSEYIRGGIRRHGGVSIPRRSITPFKKQGVALENFARERLKTPQITNFDHIKGVLLI